MTHQTKTQQPLCPARRRRLRSVIVSSTIAHRPPAGLQSAESGHEETQKLFLYTSIYLYLILERARVILLYEILLHGIGDALRDRLLVEEVDFALGWVYVDVDSPRIYLQTSKASTIATLSIIWDDQTLDKRRERRPSARYWCRQPRGPSSCAASRRGGLKYLL